MWCVHSPPRTDRTGNSRQSVVECCARTASCEQCLQHEPKRANAGSLAEIPQNASSSGYSVNYDWIMIAAWGALSSNFFVLRRLRIGLRATALEHAWKITFITWIAWLAAAITESLHLVDRGWGKCLWYLAAVAALLPPIAALGARRPINRAWTWFVLLPLFLVFAWPVMPVVWNGAHHPEAFDLETPLLLGILLVSVMGVGNYVGLRHTAAALLWLTAIWLIVLPLCSTTSGWLGQSSLWRITAVLAISAAGWMASGQDSRITSIEPSVPLNRLWQDFRELFGVVWGRRILERFNDDAQKRGAKLRLGWMGLEDLSGKPVEISADPQELGTAETSLRWLLQKFVNSEWIDQRLS